MQHGEKHTITLQLWRPQVMQSTSNSSKPDVYIRRLSYISHWAFATGCLLLVSWACQELQLSCSRGTARLYRAVMTQDTAASTGDCTGACSELKAQCCLAAVAAKGYNPSLQVYLCSLCRDHSLSLMLPQMLQAMQSPMPVVGQPCQMLVVHRCWLCIGQSMSD